MDHKKILITGSNGFLGLRLSRKLLGKGESHLRCFARSEVAQLQKTFKAKVQLIRKH